MTRRLAGVLGVCVVLFAFGAASALAAELEGPQMTLISLSASPRGVFVLSLDPDSSKAVKLLSRGLREEPLPDWNSTAVWSPTGETLALAATAGKKRTANGTETRTKIFLVNADGSDMRAIPGTEEGTDPIFSPDGHTLAFARTKEIRKPNGRGGEDTRYRSTSTWIVDLAGGSPRQLTPWRSELFNSPSSFSPDGQMLAITHEVGRNRGEAIAIPLAGGAPVVLARRGLEPTYSPDGSKIAYLSWHRFSMRDRKGEKVTGASTDVREMNADGSGSVRLTNTPKQTEVGLSWSPSGSRLAFTRLPTPDTELKFLGFGSQIVEMNADGSCERIVYSKPKAVTVGVSWRPGPGRDPGPLSC